MHTWTEDPRVADANLVTLLERAARSREGVCFVDRAERETFLTYEEIVERAAAVAGAIQSLGIEPGDPVALVLETGPEFYYAFFGVLLAGGVPMPLYPPVRLGLLDEYHRRTAGMLRACGTRLVLTSSRVRRVLGRTIAQAEPELGCLPVDALAQRRAVVLVPSAGDPALIQFSSGTLLDPKPVLLTHRQILANVYAMQRRVLPELPEGPEFVHRGVSWLPLYHDMGLIGAVVNALEHPGPLVLIPPELFLARPSIWLRAISRHRATITVAPNFAFGLCVKRIRDEELRGVDLSSLLLALNGAEPVTWEVLSRFTQRFRRFGLREEALTPVYGLSEAALAVTFSDVARPMRVERFDRESLSERGVARVTPDGRPLVSVGTALPGFSVQIVDDDRQVLPAGCLGRVLVRGPSIMQGYFRRPVETAKVLRDGWLDTGDSGFLDSGDLFLYGRTKELIVLRGRNHSPQEVEQALEGLPGLRAGCSAALGFVPEGADGEELLVLIERDRDLAPRRSAELAAAASRRVTRTTGLVPGDVIVLPPGSLPRTSSGKIRRGEALRRQLDGTLSAPGGSGPLRVASEALRSALAFARMARRRDH